MDTITRIFDLASKQFKEQRDFASALGKTTTMVSAWKTGVSKSYTKYLPEIAAVLDTTVDYLLTGKAEKKPILDGEDRLNRNIVRIAGRDGTFIERELTDEQVTLMRTMLDQLKPVDDGTL